jgi:probable F420-dependent oxidoreductase
MTWSQPAKRMREYIEALRQIWSAWDDGTKLAFAGDFYSFSLMPAFFSPAPNPATSPVYLAAVGEQMTSVAGEVADGLLTHAFTTKRYLSEVTLPTLHGAADRARRVPSDIAVSHLCLLATGRTEQDLEVAKAGARGQVAFYGSTPAYRPVLELHGWGELGDELHRLSVVRDRDTAAEMAALVSDEVLEEFVIVGPPDEVSARIEDRFGGLVDRLTFYTPYRIDKELLDEIASTS